jgi:hypothetical protein
VTAGIERALALKWMGLLILGTVLPLIVTGLSILGMYEEGLKRSFIVVEGVVLTAGVLFSFFSAGKLALLFQCPENTIGYDKKATYN